MFFAAGFVVITEIKERGSLRSIISQSFQSTVVKHFIFISFSTYNPNTPIVSINETFSNAFSG